MGTSGQRAFRVWMTLRFRLVHRAGVGRLPVSDEQPVGVPTAATPPSTSSQVDIPVEMMSGRPVSFIFRSSVWSVSDAEAAL